MTSEKLYRTFLTIAVIPLTLWIGLVVYVAEVENLSYSILLFFLMNATTCILYLAILDSYHTEEKIRLKLAIRKQTQTCHAGLKTILNTQDSYFLLFDFLISTNSKKLQFKEVLLLIEKNNSNNPIVTDKIKAYFEDDYFHLTIVATNKSSCTKTSTVRNYYSNYCKNKNSSVNIKQKVYKLL